MRYRGKIICDGFCISTPSPPAAHRRCDVSPAVTLRGQATVTFYNSSPAPQPLPSFSAPLNDRVNSTRLHKKLGHNQRSTKAEDEGGKRRPQLLGAGDREKEVGGFFFRKKRERREEKERERYLPRLVSEQLSRISGGYTY